jgi:hypothetical protein
VEARGERLYIGGVGKAVSYVCGGRRSNKQVKRIVVLGALGSQKSESFLRAIPLEHLKAELASRASAGVGGGSCAAVKHACHHPCGINP